MWRYRELMPIFDDEEPVTLGEGFTPLLHARALGRRLGLERLYVKDESLNPTNSFKARGQSAAITRARGLGATTMSLPTAGNAGNAAAAYCARAPASRAKVFIPKDAKRPFVRRVPAVRRRRHARRRADHRRRRGWRPNKAGRSAGTTSRR